MFSVLMGAVIFVVACGVSAWSERRNAAKHAGDPTWYSFLFGFSLLALVTGLVLGEMIYRIYTEEHFQYTQLNSYSDVDPSGTPGKQLMDAGIVDFKNGTHLELDKAMGFRNADTYCVAPIALTGVNTSSYDFWAVGVNCCDGGQNNFQCGDYAVSRAKSALRLLDNSNRAYFRLAVQQAEAKYGITAKHPLFFEWSLDSAGTVNDMLYKGMTQFGISLVGFFLANVFFCIVFVLMQMRTGTDPKSQALAHV